MCVSSSLCVDCHVVEQCFTFLAPVIVTDTDVHSMTCIHCWYLDLLLLTFVIIMRTCLRVHTWSVRRQANRPPPVNRSPVRSPPVLVTPVKRPPDEVPYAVKSPPPLGQSPHTQNVFCLFSLGLCFVSICFFMCLCLPIPLCTFLYDFWHYRN